LSELRELIVTDLQKRFVNDPQVFVDLVEANYRPISVIGAVNTPGNLKDVFSDLTLVEVITRAGGIAENAGDDILIMRKTPDNLTKTLKISYTELWNDADLNIPIMPGDTINIPISKPVVVSVLGEVNRPGQFEFKERDRVTLLRIIAAAGGFTDFARRNRVVVRRMVNGKSIENKIDVRAIQEKGDPDFVLKHNDIVSVP
jgi:polysaccharide export outer membrane protein